MPPPALTRVAVYRRRIGAGADRVWENVRDWEHLPWLHRTSFRSIERLAEGDWGWRARIRLQPEGAAEIVLELVIEPEQSEGDLRDRGRAAGEPGAARYVSRTLEGPGAGSEIWTRVSPIAADRSDIEVEFWLPEVDPARADALGAAYTSLYQRLWDEDEAMMVRRAALLCAREAAADGALPLGPPEALRARLPLCVEWGGRRWRILEIAGELIVHATVCPHALGPLDQAAVDADGCVRCPWHGYRFDVRSGRSVDGGRLRLARAPHLALGADGGVWLGGPAQQRTGSAVSPRRIMFER